MKKQKTILIPNLRDLTFSQVLDLAYQVAKFHKGKTYEDIAEETGKGKETIYRYFTDPNYNPPTHFLPRLCKSLGNYLIVEWLCVQCGGYFCDDIDARYANLEKEIAELTKEFSDVLREHSIAAEDSYYSQDEISGMEKEIIELQAKAAQIRMLLKQMKGAAL